MSENQEKNIITDWAVENVTRLTEMKSKQPELYSAVQGALNYLNVYLGGKDFQAQIPQIENQPKDSGIPNDILKLVENLYVEGLTIDNKRISKLPDALIKKVELNQNLPITFRYENRTSANLDKYNVVYLIYGDKFEIVVFSDRYYDSNNYRTYENSFAEGDTNFKPIITELPFERSPIWKELDFVPPSDLKKAFDVVRLKNKKDPNYKKYLKWLLNLFGVVYSIKIKVGSDEWKTYMNTVGRSIETSEIEYANKMDNIYVYYFSLFEKYRKTDIFKTYNYSLKKGNKLFDLNDGLIYYVGDKFMTPTEIEDSFYEWVLIAFQKDFEYNTLSIPKLIDESDFYLGTFLKQPTTKVVLTAQEKSRLEELQAKEDTDSLTKSENSEYEKLVAKYRLTDDFEQAQAQANEDKDDFQDLLDDIENLDI